MNIEHELRDALRRKQAPPDLADRVLARINESAAPAPRTGHGSSLAMRWLAAAAIVTLTVGGAERYYTQQKAAEAARVQQELQIALQITNNALAVVQTKLSQPAGNGGR